MIGVVISAYNQQETIGDTIKSVILQRDNLDCGIDIILIDDASIPPIEKMYPFPVADDVSIQWLQVPDNRGVQEIRNLGFKMFRDRSPSRQSEYIIFTDGDVTFNPKVFKAMKRALEASGPDIAYAYGHYTRRGYVSGRFPSRSFNERELRLYNYISTMSLIKFPVLRDLFDKPFVEDEQRLQDWSLWLRLLNAGYKGMFVDRVIFSAYFAEKSISVRDQLDYEKWRQIIAGRYNPK